MREQDREAFHTLTDELGAAVARGNTDAIRKAHKDIGKLIKAEAAEKERHQVFGRLKVQTHDAIEVFEAPKRIEQQLLEAMAGKSLSGALAYLIENQDFNPHFIEPRNLRAYLDWTKIPSGSTVHSLFSIGLGLTG